MAGRSRLAVLENYLFIIFLASSSEGNYADYFCHRPAVFTSGTRDAPLVIHRHIEPSCEVELYYVAVLFGCCRPNDRTWNKLLGKHRKWLYSSNNAPNVIFANETGSLNLHNFEKTTSALSEIVLLLRS